jgi:hypothetical protein
VALPPRLAQWTAPQGHADIAPSRHERIEYDGYLTIEAPWIVPALLDGVPAIAGRILEPAAGRGHLSLELRRTGLEVVSFDLRRYANPLIDDIGIGDIRELTTLKGFDFVVTNLPNGDLEELATHLICKNISPARIFWVERASASVITAAWRSWFAPSGSSQKRAADWCTSTPISPAS